MAKTTEAMMVPKSRTFRLLFLITHLQDGLLDATILSSRKYQAKMPWVIRPKLSSIEKLGLHWIRF